MWLHTSSIIKRNPPAEIFWFLKKQKEGIYIYMPVCVHTHAKTQSEIAFPFKRCKLEYTCISHLLITQRQWAKRCPKLQKNSGAWQRNDVTDHICEICASQRIIFNLRSQLFSQNIHTLQTISNASYLLLPKLVQVL